ncbi:MAG: ribosome maturation factor RimP [Halanaerobiales bacterium]
MGKIVKEVTGLAKPIVNARDLKLVDVNFLKEGSGWTLKVFIENPAGELKIKDCEEISRMLSDELDRKDPIDKSYILEVSSPGIERPLKDKADYEKYTGQLIQVTTYAPVNGKKEFKGRIVGIEDKEVLLEIEEKNQSKGVVRIPLTKIANAHLSVEI